MSAATVQGALAWLTLLTLTYPAHTALAHDPPKGLSLVFRTANSSEAPVIVTNRGLVFQDELEAEGRLSLRCNEGYGANVADRPALFYDAAGALILGGYNRVSITSDRACTLQPTSGLPDESITNLVRNDGVPNRMFVATRIVKSPASLWISEDYGHSWAQRYQNPLDTFFESLLAAPSDPERLYAASVHYDQVNLTVTYSCALSLDGGKSWAHQAQPSKIVPFAVHPRDADVVFAYEPIDKLETMFRVLRSEDRGASFQSVLESVQKPSALTSGAGQSLWLGVSAAGRGGLFRSDDAGKHFAQVQLDSVQSVSCLAQREGRLWMCANMAPNTNGVWYSDDEGVTFRKHMTFEDVAQPLVCEANLAICAGPWYDFSSEVHPPAADAGVVADAGVEQDAAAVLEEPDAAPEPELADEPATEEEADASVTPESKRRSSGCRTLPSGRFDLGALLVLLAGVAQRRRRASVV